MLNDSGFLIVVLPDEVVQNKTYTLPGRDKPPAGKQQVPDQPGISDAELHLQEGCRKRAYAVKSGRAYNSTSGH